MAQDASFDADSVQFEGGPPVSVREVAILGTASQTPTRERNHNGYLLRWDRLSILFDPGEGTQRQLTCAGLAAARITHICLSHLHGDHCLGLPGILQRMNQDRVDHLVHLFFPASGAPFVDRLCRASAYDNRLKVELHPIEESGPVMRIGDACLSVERLDHRIDCFGYRLSEDDDVTMVPERLAAAGIAGPAIGQLRQRKAIDVEGRAVALADVSVPRPGQSFAFVMDTRVCDGARRLLAGVDLGIVEATFLDRDRALAAEYGHLTATQAGELLAGAGARLGVLTHFSQRYENAEEFRTEAGRLFPGVVVAADFDRVPLPSRGPRQTDDGANS